MEYGRDIGQFKHLVISPVLRLLNMHSDVAVNLMLGTALQESRLIYNRQLGGGPALGFYQMEPASHDDIHENFLVYRLSLRRLVINITNANLEAESLVDNLQYATVMCRLQYFRVKEKLPENNAADLSRYWKKYYNTHKGKGNEVEAIPHFQNAIDA